MSSRNDEDDFGDLEYPSTSEKLERHIGAFFVAWGVLERELDNGFPVLFRTDPTLACCLYANLGTKAKLDILRSAIGMLAQPLGPALTTRSHDILQSVSNLSDIARNTLAHGQVHSFFDETSNTLMWELIRHVARKSHSMVIHPGTARYWGTQQRAVVTLARRWRKCVGAMYLKTKSLSLDDLEEVCVSCRFETAHQFRNVAVRTSLNRSPR
jgi:hypothetical protein